VDHRIDEWIVALLVPEAGHDAQGLHLSCDAVLTLGRLARWTFKTSTLYCDASI